MINVCGTKCNKDTSNHNSRILRPVRAGLTHKILRHLEGRIGLRNPAFHVVTDCFYAPTPLCHGLNRRPDKQENLSISTVMNDFFLYYIFNELLQRQYFLFNL